MDVEPHFPPDSTVNVCSVTEISPQTNANKQLFELEFRLEFYDGICCKINSTTATITDQYVLARLDSIRESRLSQDISLTFNAFICPSLTVSSSMTASAAASGSLIV